MINKSLNYRVGLDIGIGSVGYCILEHNEQDEPTKIVELGVRVFDPAEKPDSGKSLALDRRSARSSRRRLRRKNLKLSIAKSYLASAFSNLNLNSAEFYNNNVYELRNKALIQKEKISNDEIARIILFMVKHRGFLSTRKSDNNSKENGKVLKSINENVEYMKGKGYLTVGQMLFNDTKYNISLPNGKFVRTIRNKNDDYSHSLPRKLLNEELKLILQKQKDIGNNEITQEFIDFFTDDNKGLIMYQRSFDEGPSAPSIYHGTFKIGKCTFYPEEDRASKGTFTFEYFSALQKINSLKIKNKIKEDRELTLDEKKLLLEKALIVNSLKYSSIRKILNLTDDDYFNMSIYSNKVDIEKSENKDCVSFKNSREILKALGYDNLKENSELLDKLGTILSLNKSDNKILQELNNQKILLNEEQKNNILNISFNKFSNLSIKAMKEIIPYLEKGDRYDLAVTKCNFKVKEDIKSKYLDYTKISEFEDITSPVVKRAVIQTFRVINKIIQKYGSPQRINIELSREMSKNYQDRLKIEKEQIENYNQNEKLKKEITEKFGKLNPSNLDVLRYKLFEEQGGKCAYSGKILELSQIFDNNTQIDHIIPYSKSLDDSFSNKVLVLSVENQQKGNRLPLEYMANDKNKIESFINYCKSTYTRFNQRKKLSYLLKDKWTQDDSENFTQRNLCDTEYMARFLLNVFQNYLLFKPSKKFDKKPVLATKGYITSYMRKCYGLNKVRENGDKHHAMDAFVIACVSDSYIQKISNFNKYKELGYKLIRKSNGSVSYFSTALNKEITQEEKDNQIEFDEQELNKLLPLPYDNAREEFLARYECNDYLLNDKGELRNDNSLENTKLKLQKLGYSQEELRMFKPIFVSRMKSTKLIGTIHAATLKSAKHYFDKGIAIYKVKLKDLSLKEEKETINLKDDKHPNYSIPNYYRPQDDRLLYLYLKDILFDAKANKISMPFANKVIYKPNKDGTVGAIVKSVKVYEKTSHPFIIEKETKQGKLQTIADNDSMVRVDVFKKNGKYFLCPIYAADVYRHKLPNKLILREKTYDKWQDLDDSFEFQFSLFKNDLLYIKSNRNIELSKYIKENSENKAYPDKIRNKEFLLYYNSCDISNASIKLYTNDRNYIGKSIGIKTLLDMKKYVVDDLGNYYEGVKENRKQI
jgi:CRISPR-associated endonuclease Csn1